MHRLLTRFCLTSQGLSQSAKVAILRNINNGEKLILKGHKFKKLQNLPWSKNERRTYAANLTR